MREITSFTAFDDVTNSHTLRLRLLTFGDLNRLICNLHTLVPRKFECKYSTDGLIEHIFPCKLNRLYLRNCPFTLCVNWLFCLGPHLIYENERAVAEDILFSFVVELVGSQITLDLGDSDFGNIVTLHNVQPTVWHVALYILFPTLRR